MISWLKKIFRVEVIGVIVAIGAALLTVPQFVKDTGGRLDIKYNEAFNGVIPKVVVVDQQNTNFLRYVLPTLYNNSRYSLNNFLLTFQLNSPAQFFLTSNEFTIKNNGIYNRLIYNYHIFFAHSEILPPDLSIKINSDSTYVEYSIKATFDGAKEPYLITNRIKVIYIPPQNNLENWESIVRRMTHNEQSTYIYVKNKFSYLNNSTEKEELYDRSIQSEDSLWIRIIKALGYCISYLGISILIIWCFEYLWEKSSFTDRICKRLNIDNGDYIDYIDFSMFFIFMFIGVFGALFLIKYFFL